MICNGSSQGPGEFLGMAEILQRVDTPAALGLLRLDGGSAQDWPSCYAGTQTDASVHIGGRVMEDPPHEQYLFRRQIHCAGLHGLGSN